MHAVSRTIVAVVVIVLIFAAASGYLYAYPPASSKSTVARSLETYTNYRCRSGDLNEHDHGSDPW